MTPTTTPITATTTPPTPTTASTLAIYCTFLASGSSLPSLTNTPTEEPVHLQPIQLQFVGAYHYHVPHV
jgi:hypothetical protein